ncbi:MAG TPA: L-seryl-tRNA(Sec) selenium transferase [Chloroflexi bacterium]|nr:L-seryl-tRNA(Sec) selenium transferase [Chloroflexota bacterium]
MTNDKLRQLPGVDILLKHTKLTDLADAYSHNIVVEAARAELDLVRQGVLTHDKDIPAETELLQAIVARAEAMVKPTLQTVINATGVVVHTNLGRALLSQRARRAMDEAAQAYSNLEYDLDRGARGSRYHHAEALLCRLTGAEAAVVVNNNAAALVLSLTVLAQGREVLISRGQLIEIGGGFRIPDIMRQSGATLVEVGATNRTYIRDYEENFHAETGLILRVHRSNFRITGFTAEPNLADLVDLGARRGVPVMDDLGSGTLLDTAQYGLTREPTLQESVAAGVSLVTASGDKLLGGPQAGIILGKADIIERLKKHPLIRAFRVDKTTLAGLQATLLAYLEGKAAAEIPVWRMISTDIKTLDWRARKWQRALFAVGLKSEVINTASTVGGGSLPGQQLPTRALGIQNQSPNLLAEKLRDATPPVIARVEADLLTLDPRTVLPEQDNQLIEVLQSTLTLKATP